jgi:hypothetical protein
MTNSYVTCLISVVKAILEDIAITYPSDRRGLERDLARLLLLVGTRGLTVFTLDFPAALKHFDSCLSGGAYTKSGVPCMASTRRGVIPKLFQGILLRIFQPNGMLRSDAEHFAMAAYRQLLAVGIRSK